MWSKRKEDEVPLRPERPAATPGAFGPGVEPQRREISTMSSPNRTFEPETGAVRSGSAALGKNVTVKGQIVAREDLTSDGEVEGTVECHEHRLTIGHNARVQSNLKAREIVIHGSIQGHAEAADKIGITEGRKLVGDSKTRPIVIADGANFEGSIDISTTAQVTSPPQSQPQTQPQPVSQPAPQPASVGSPIGAGTPTLK